MLLNTLALVVVIIGLLLVIEKEERRVGWSMPWCETNKAQAGHQANKEAPTPTERPSSFKSLSSFES